MDFSVNAGKFLSNYIISYSSFLNTPFLSSYEKERKKRMNLESRLELHKV